MKWLLLSFILAGLPATAQSEKKPETSKPKKPAASQTTKPKAPVTKPKTTSETAKEPSSEEPKKSEMATEGKEAGKSPHGKPAVISTTDLADFETLPADRKKLIEGAIAVAKESPWLPYKFGGSAPTDGGFDCSGAMYFTMGKSGLKPPRTSADQYNWLKENNRLHEIPADVVEFTHPSLAKLQPGDLLFWSGTYAPTDGRTANITHVAMFLGKEKKGNRPVMINATDGRSYRGTQANGYGVYDFYLPKAGSKSKFVGYGTPVGIAEIAPSASESTPEETSEKPTAKESE
jgi:cell wall-associated NlpC family hydrolase